jgi:hypothetical protein
MDAEGQCSFTNKADTSASYVVRYMAKINAMNGRQKNETYAQIQ